jgi:Tol biopolymer transport system component
MHSSSAGNGVLVSPDGSLVFFQAPRRDRGVVMRPLDQPVSIPLPNTELGRLLAASPDGRWILFSTLTDLKRVTLPDRTVSAICQTETVASSAAISVDGQIAFTTAAQIWIVPASGGTPRVLTTLDKGEQVHVADEFLPDGKTLLFTNWVSEGPRLEALTLATGARTRILDNAAGAKYLTTGHLLFVRDGALMATRFDSRTMTVTGAPARVIDHVRIDMFGQPKLSASADGGVLVYAEPAITSLVWVTRTGQESKLDLAPRGFDFVRIARDGRRLAFSDPNGIWVTDLARGGAAHISSERFIYGQMDWSPDGSRLSYSALKDLVVRSADGSGVATRVGTEVDVRKMAPSWSPDGKWIAYNAYFGATNSDVYVAPADGSGPSRPLVATPAYDGGPQFSPDGQFVAYTSSETGHLEAYVTPFPGPGPRLLVSTNGGTHVRWSRDGHELYYRNGDDMMAVAITPKPSFSAGKPVLLFRGRYSYGSGTGIATYDVAADGRFLMIKAEDETVERPRIIVNWAEALRRALADRQ